jgi:hypothetical protein
MERTEYTIQDIALTAFGLGTVLYLLCRAYTALKNREENEGIRKDLKY